MAQSESRRRLRASTAAAGRVQSSDERVLTSTNTRQSCSRKTKSISPRSDLKFAVRNLRPSFFRRLRAARSPSKPCRRCRGRSDSAFFQNFSFDRNPISRGGSQSQQFSLCGADLWSAGCGASGSAGGAKTSCAGRSAYFPFLARNENCCLKAVPSGQAEMARSSACESDRGQVA